MAANGRGKASPREAIQIQWVTPLNSPQEEPNSISGWTAAIKKTWAHGPASTLELARLITQAKGALQYGEWSQLFRAGRLPFCKRKGEMLWRIGTNLGKLDAYNYAHLPTAWNTLYHLALLGRSTVDHLIHKGRIHPGTSLKEAKTLVAEFGLGRPRKKPRPAVLNRVNRLAMFVQATLPAWSQRERRLVKHELLALLETISAVANRNTNHKPL